jgi:hypothetical protein
MRSLCRDANRAGVRTSSARCNAPAARRAMMRAVPSRRRKRLLAAVTLLGALALPASARSETWVSFPALLQQLRTGEVIRAIINPARGDAEIKFRNLSEWHAYYPRGKQRELQRLLAARHIRVLFVPRRRAHPARHAAVHHHVRYIVAGVLAACAIAAGVFLLLRRRRSPPPPEPSSTR